MILSGFSTKKHPYFFPSLLTAKLIYKTPAKNACHSGSGGLLVVVDFGFLTFHFIICPRSPTCPICFLDIDFCTLAFFYNFPLLHSPLKKEFGTNFVI